MYYFYFLYFKTVTIYLAEIGEFDWLLPQSHSQCPCYPYPVAELMGNQILWDKASRLDRILGLPVLTG